MDGARHRADRPAGRQPLPVRGDGRAAGADYETCVENIDIGGPAMIRAAAKNHADVAVVVDAARLRRRGRRRSRPRAARAAASAGGWPARAFARTAAYDAAVSAWMARGGWATRRRAPRLRRRGWRSRSAMARTRTSAPPSTSTARPGPGVATARQLQGKELSYNNINDTDAAFELVAELGPRPARRARSSSTPTRAAWRRRETLADAYRARLRLRPRLGLRRHRRAQPPAGRGDGAADRRDLHRGRHRARRRRGRARRLRGEEEPAPAADRRRCRTRPRRGWPGGSVAGGFLVQDARHRATSRRRPARS